LLTVADRSAGGYRLYDEAAVTRLRFIERAKQLGLPLEEIRELVAVWDGGQCFTFTLHPAGDSVTLDVQAVDDAAAVVVELFGTPG